jgi:septum formation protein
MNLFTYGSLQLPAIMARVVQTSYAHTAATLTGYQRFEVRGQTYPGLIESAKAQVEGVLYFDIDPAQWPALDAFESEYQRITVQVATAQGPVEAQTYRYLDQGNLLPSIWSFEHFKAVGVHSFMRDYVARHTANPPLILASSSRYRQAQLTALGLAFTAQSPDIDERVLPGETPRDNCLRLAISKAQAIAVSTPSLIIGSDQVLDLDGEAISKPGDFATALDQLTRAQGKTLTVYTAIALRNSADESVHSAVVPTRITYRDLPQAELVNYLHREQPYDCAGSVKSEAGGLALLSQISADDPSALIGLPLIQLCDFLRASGYGFFK